MLFWGNNRQSIVHSNSNSTLQHHAVVDYFPVTSQRIMCYIPYFLSSSSTVNTPWPGLRFPVFISRLTFQQHPQCTSIPSHRNRRLKESDWRAGMLSALRRTSWWCCWRRVRGARWSAGRVQTLAGLKPLALNPPNATLQEVMDSTDWLKGGFGGRDSVCVCVIILH